MLISLSIDAAAAGRADNERSTVSQGGLCHGRHASASIDRLRTLDFTGFSQLVTTLDPGVMLSMRSKAL